ncbi:MAG: putative ABC transporter permease [Candidatus Saccharibacteria bacterium]|nr:putative ABC transporter permease [Candidatus Saccharibacteria bacterium]
MNLTEAFLCFLIYSFIGWFWEDCLTLVREHRFVNRGFLNGPYCPIYGVGGLLFLLFGQFVENPVLLFFIGGTTACILEYITSYIMEKLFKARWWDYSDWPLNLNGRICLYGFLAFGAASVGIRLIHPQILSFVQWLPNNTTWAIVLAIIFVADIVTTNQSFAKFTKILRKYQSILKKGHVVQFFERNGRQFIKLINDSGHRIFTWQQVRIIRAFPNFQTHYDKAYNELQKFYKKTKYQPKQNAHARKKSKKILK